MPPQPAVADVGSRKRPFYKNAEDHYENQKKEGLGRRRPQDT